MATQNTTAAAANGDGASPTEQENLPGIIFDEWWMKNIDRTANAAMVVASVIAAMAFQIAANPPGGLWQDDNYLFDSAGNTVDPLGNPIPHAVDAQNRTVLNPHRAGSSIFATNDPHSFQDLCRNTTSAYYSSLTIILLVVTRLPCTNIFFALALIVLIFVTVLASMTTYCIAAAVSMPATEYRENEKSYNVFIVVLFLIAIFKICEIWRYMNREVRRRGAAAASSGAAPHSNSTVVI